MDSSSANNVVVSKLASVSEFALVYIVLKLSPKKSFLLSLCLFMLGIALWGYTFSQYVSFANDYRIQEYPAGRALIENRSIYAEFESDVIEVSGQHVISSNFHPPFAVLIFAPLSIFPYEIAALLQSLGMLVCLCAAIYLAMREIGFSRQACLGFTGIGLLTNPTMHCAASFNYSPLIAVLIVLAWRSLRRMSQYKAGIFFGLATALKIYPILMFIPLCLSKKYSNLITFVIALFISVVVTLALISLSEIHYYYFVAISENISQYGGYPLNFSLHAIIYSALAKTPWSMPLINLESYALDIVTTAKAIFAALYLFLIWRIRKNANAAQLCAITSGFMLMLLPISWSHGLFALLILIAELVLIAQNSPKHKKSIFIALAISFILFCLPDRDISLWLSQHFDAQPPWEYLLFARLPFFGILILTVTFYHSICTSRSTKDSSIN